MKFDCDQCGTRYNIADEKVRRKVLKIRCRVCEHVITVRGADLKQADDAPADGKLTDSGWFAAPDGDELGPMPLERLQTMVEAGEIGADALVWCDGMPDWIAVGAVPELLEYLPKTSGLDEEATSTFEVHDRIDDSLRRSLTTTPPPRAERPPPAEYEPERGAGIGWGQVHDERPTVAEPRIGPLVPDAAGRVSGDPQRRMLMALIGLAVLVLLALVVAVAWYLSQPAGMRPTLLPGPLPQQSPPPTQVPEAAPAPTPPTGAAPTPGAPVPTAAGAPATLEPDQVKAVLAEHKDAIEACRARHVAQSGPLKSTRALLTFDLRPTGRVSSPDLADPLGDSVFARCIGEEARSWRFPVFTGAPIPVQYPFEVPAE